MKKYITTIVVIGAAFAASASQPSQRDTVDMKSAAEFVVTKMLVQTSEPVSIGQGKYEVTVTVAEKVCKATVVQSPDEVLSPWHWKVSSVKCPGK